MKNILKIILALFIVNCSFLIAQVDNHISVERGSTTELTWKTPGDYSSYDSLYFVVKPCTLNSCVRLIQKPVTDTYSEPYTTMTCTLYVDETASFNAARYFYSIYAYGADTVWVTSGNFNLMLNGQTPTDGVPTRTPYYTVALDTPAHEPSFISGLNSTNQWRVRSKTQMRDDLDIIDSTSVEADLDSLYTYWVNKHEAQTITGQKNFSGTIPIKLNADSSIRLGGQYSTVPAGIIKTQNASDYPLYIHSQLIHADTSTVGDWRIYSQFLDWDTLTTRTFTNYCIGYNGQRRGNKPWMATGMEPEYELGYLGTPKTYYEWWYEFQFPATNIQYSNRPLQITQSVPYSGDADSITALGVFSLDQLWMGNPVNGGFYLDWQFTKTGYSYVDISDSFYINYQVNNLDWLYQAAYGGSPKVSLIKLDNEDDVVISPMVGYKIKLGNNLSGDISWRNNLNSADITIEPDTTDIVKFTNDAGISINNIRIRSLSTDSTGTKTGELWADPNTGVVKYNLGTNLIVNGDFSAWTGGTPDSWDTGTPDTTNFYYVNDSNRLRYISNTSLSSQCYQGSATTGTTYAYSFFVSAITDTFYVFITDAKIEYITATGLYRGTVTSNSNTSLISLVPRYDACDITIDNIKVWNVDGAKATTYELKESLPQMLNPTADDTLFLGRKEVGAIYDSLRVFDIQDSICVQAFYRTDADYSLITTPDTLISDTTIAFDTTTVPAGAKVYLYFIYIGDSEAYLRSQLYYRE